MRREAGPSMWLIAALLLGSLPGCQALFGRPSLPEDPLFVDRKPLESKTDTTRPPVGWTEPPPPANPYFAGQAQQREVPQPLETAITSPSP